MACWQDPASTDGRLTPAKAGMRRPSGDSGPDYSGGAGHGLRHSADREHFDSGPIRGCRRKIAAPFRLVGPNFERGCRARSRFASRHRGCRLYALTGDKAHPVRTEHRIYRRPRNEFKAAGNPQSIQVYGENRPRRAGPFTPPRRLHGLVLSAGAPARSLAADRGYGWGRRSSRTGRLPPHRAACRCW